MASYPPPPPGYDPRQQRRYYRDQARAQRAAWRLQREQMRYQMRAMRRRSVLGPLLLIAVGVVFLLIQTGHLDRSRFWEWYGHWWPLVLVCAGAVALAEWALDQAAMRDPQHPVYRRSVGSGVVFLLILFAFVGVIANHNLGFPSGYSKLFPGYHFDENSLDELFGDKHESDQMLDVAFPAAGSLAVVNPRGDVTVNGTSDDGRIHIALHKAVYSPTDSEADSKAQQFSPAVSTDGNVVSIRMPAMDGARGDLVITAPAAAAVTIDANRGDIHVASVNAPVTATANHGDIELAAITAAVTAHINNGGSSITAHAIDGALAVQGHGQDLTLADISGPVTINGDYFGTTHLEHIRGSIHFHSSRTDIQFARLDGELELSASGISADQALGPVALSTSNRNITLDRMSGDISATNRNGSINLTAAPPLGSYITLEDRNGSITATLPAQANFVMQANTSNGTVDTDFALTTQSSEHGRSLSGTVGSGGPVVHIATTNADITVRKGDIPPLPPLPPALAKITLTPPATAKAPAAHKAAKAPSAPTPPSN